MKSKINKNRVKRIKGWADMSIDGEIVANSLHGKVRSLPCIIIIKEKYFKDNKL
jgi:hypothetical protein